MDFDIDTTGADIIFTTVVVVGAATTRIGFTTGVVVVIVGATVVVVVGATVVVVVGATVVVVGTTPVIEFEALDATEFPM